MNALLSYSVDELAAIYGGWATLCDPKFTQVDHLYAEFESAGMTKFEFDKLRDAQRMPARLRVLLDVAEHLLRIWARYLSGLLKIKKGEFAGSFVENEHVLPAFVSRNKDAIADYVLTAGGIESFIRSCIKCDGATEFESEYIAERKSHIRALALLCQGYPPDDPEGHSPALVPSSPAPPNDSASSPLGN